MRNLFTRIGLLCIIGTIVLGGCTPEQRAANEAKAKAVLTAINNGARVTADAIKQGIDAACANQSAVAMSGMAARAVFLQQTGPNTTQNIDNLDRALVAFNNACAASAGGTTPTASMLRAAISAYNSVKAAQAATGG